jgi:predicted nucleic acid-binding protein
VVFTRVSTLPGVKALGQVNPEAKWDTLSRGPTVLFCSPATVAELWHGARQQDDRTLQALFAAIQSIPIDAEVGQRAGVFLRQYAKSRGVELGDALIAATASVYDLQLWAGNRRHYPMKDLSFF